MNGGYDFAVIGTHQADEKMYSVKGDRMFDSSEQKFYVFLRKRLFYPKIDRSVLK